MAVTRLGPIMALPFTGGDAPGPKTEAIALAKQESVGRKGYLMRSSAFKRISSYILTILGV